MLLCSLVHNINEIKAPPSPPHPQKKQKKKKKEKKQLKKTLVFVLAITMLRECKLPATWNCTLEICRKNAGAHPPVMA